MSELAEIPPEGAPEAAIALQVTLELEVPPGGAGRLFSLPALAALRAGRIRAVPARIIWRDTPDGKLAAAGLVLAEIDGSAVLQHARRDGICPWPPGTPAQIADPIGEPPELSVASFAGTRKVLPLAQGGLLEASLLEGAWQVGAWQVGALVRQSARLTLRGAADNVFPLAETLLHSGLTVPATSLGGEVLAALHGAAAPSAPVLRADLTLDDAFAHVVGALAAVLLHYGPDAAAGHAPEPVHQMRVALRRLRSALSLFRKAADSVELDSVKVKLGALARALGPARDWDVFVAGAGREAATLLPGEPALPRLLAAAGRRRRAAYDSLAVLLGGEEFQRALLDLTRLALTRPWRNQEASAPTLGEFAERALERRLRRVLAAGDDLAPLPTSELHALRIQCKRLRYAAEFFAPLSSGRRVRRFLRRLAAVQERLGQVNDGSVAAGLLQELGTKGFAAGVVVGTIAARTAGSRDKAASSWRKFLDTEPFRH